MLLRSHVHLGYLEEYTLVVFWFRLWNHGLISHTVLGKTVETYHFDKSSKLDATRHQSSKSQVVP